jgi:dihydrolipoamide dehydrogenase
LKNAEVVSYFLRSEEFGLSFDNFHADYGSAVDRSRSVVDRNVRGVSYLLRSHNVDHITGEGRLSGNGVVSVGDDGTRLQAKNIIIATGSTPRSIPSLPIDGDKIISSRESIILKELPSSMVIVGGGAIGMIQISEFNTYSSATNDNHR